MSQKTEKAAEVPQAEATQPAEAARSLASGLAKTPEAVPVLVSNPTVEPAPQPAAAASAPAAAETQTQADRDAALKEKLQKEAETAAAAKVAEEKRLAEEAKKAAAAAAAGSCRSV